MAILNKAGRTAIDPGDLNTFATPPRQVTVRGPVRLYRFGKPAGRWWFDAELFNTLREDFSDVEYGGVPRQKGDDGTRYLRYSLAVSREWNKLAWLSVLSLKAGEDLNCFIGPTAEQPEWHNKQDGPMLLGGTMQYVIYETSMVPARNFSEMSVMSLWRKWS